MKKLLSVIVMFILGAMVITGQFALASAQVPTTPTHPAGLPWQGYILVQVAPVGPFVNGITDEVLDRVREGLAIIAEEHTDWPPYALQIGPINLARTAFIVEARFAQLPTKAQVCQLIANRMGYTASQVSNAVTFTLFAAGGTWEESHAAAGVYLDANRSAWEPAE